MKKKKSAIIIIAAILVLGLIAAAIFYFVKQKPSETVDVEAEYNSLLNNFYEVISAPETAEPLHNGVISLQNITEELGESALDTLSYVISDINGDGVEELLIGCFEECDSEDVKNEIYAAFSHNGYDTVLLFEKQARNTFALTDTNTFYFYGSDDSNYHIIAEYEVSEKSGLVCKDFYFTYPKPDTAGELGYFHNTSGDWTSEGSELLDITAEEFEAIRSELAAKSVQLGGEKLSTLAD